MTDDKCTIFWKIFPLADYGRLDLHGGLRFWALEQIYGMQKSKFLLKFMSHLEDWVFDAFLMDVQKKVSIEIYGPFVKSL